VRKVASASPTIGKSVVMLSPFATAAGEVLGQLGSVALRVCDMYTFGLEDVLCTSYNSVSGECGSAVIAGNGTLVGIHVGTGFVNGDKCNYFIKVTA
jgi:hypothetical protein